MRKCLLLGPFLAPGATSFLGTYLGQRRLRLQAVGDKVARDGRGIALHDDLAGLAGDERPGEDDLPRGRIAAEIRATVDDLDAVGEVKDHGAVGLGNGELGDRAAKRGRRGVADEQRPARCPDDQRVHRAQRIRHLAHVPAVAVGQPPIGWREGHVGLRGVGDAPDGPGRRRDRINVQARSGRQVR